MAKKAGTKKAGAATKKTTSKKKAPIGKAKSKKARGTKAASRRKSAAKGGSVAILKNIKAALNKKGIEPEARITNALAFF